MLFIVVFQFIDRLHRQILLGKNNYYYCISNMLLALLEKKIFEVLNLYNLSHCFRWSRQIESAKLTNAAIVAGHISPSTNQPVATSSSSSAANQQPPASGAPSSSTAEVKTLAPEIKEECKTPGLGSLSSGGMTPGIGIGGVGLNFSLSLDKEETKVGQKISDLFFII